MAETTEATKKPDQAQGNGRAARRETEGKRKRPPDDHTPLRVRKGQTVGWYPRGNLRQEPHLAFVTAVYERTLDLSVLHRGHRQFTTYEGVRHVADERPRPSERREMGGWDVLPEGKELNALRTAFQAVHKRVTVIEDRLVAIEDRIARRQRQKKG